MALSAYWDADIVDQNGVPPGTIISVTDPFLVRFHVELRGELWHCIHGDWCFDLKFTSIGDGPNFDLSDKVPAAALDVKGWDGCQTRCIEVKYAASAKGTQIRDRLVQPEWAKPRRSNNVSCSRK